ncbi:unnamed protein product [Closterium sp. NIES-64]|nr:unnamed protein product [Closterium sp. NIES-64]
MARPGDSIEKWLAAAQEKQSPSQNGPAERSTAATASSLRSNLSSTFNRTSSNPDPASAGGANSGKDLKSSSSLTQQLESRSVLPPAPSSEPRTRTYGSRLGGDFSPADNSSYSASIRENITFARGTDSARGDVAPADRFTQPTRADVAPPSSTGGSYVASSNQGYGNGGAAPGGKANQSISNGSVGLGGGGGSGGGGGGGGNGIGRSPSGTYFSATALSNRSQGNGSPRNSSENEKLYEAYNELHRLAQHFQKPFDAPAVLIVGHQTDGKSALVEALMGFQFNHVGGGTKTRRPITLQMKYNPACVEPRCYLVLDKDHTSEQEKTLQQLQAYIESENQRLEKDMGRFSDREVVVRVEYKYCPNLTIIDTPGLISAAPSVTHTALQEQARIVEALVLAKMKQQEFVILCLEDSSDWSNATTRRIVMKVDPDLSRTILVSTKLDTRIPQFSRAADVEMFLNPPLPDISASRLATRPFFTSVPSGRVGSGSDAVFMTDDDFRDAVARREMSDLAALEDKMGRPLSDDERARVGVSQLRLFLEQMLQQRYLESVPYIVPLLDKEYKSVSTKLSATSAELQNLSDGELREKSRNFRDNFVRKLTVLLRGSIAAPPDKFGETLQEERARGGIFVGSDGQQFPQRHMPNASMRLFGGAQYHRAMAEFRFVVGAVRCPAISREEIVNACGVEDVHDGTNYFRTACVIAVAKAWDVFEPFLRQLGFRLSHIVGRLLPIVLFLLKRDNEPMLVHETFIERVQESYHKFVDATERSCIDKCMEDLTSTTRFVTWSLHNRSRSALRSFFDSAMPNHDSSLLAAVGAFEASTPMPVPAATSRQNSPPFGPTDYQSSPSDDGRGDRGAVGGTNRASGNGTTAGGTASGGAGGAGSTAGGAAGAAAGGSGTGGGRLADLLESTLWTRRLAPSSEDIVNALVMQIFEGIRDHFVMSAELKFNCFFLMPLMDRFPARLREDLEAVAGGGLDAVFDISRVRGQLERSRGELDEELRRVHALQAKFASIHHSLSVMPSHAMSAPTGSLFSSQTGASPLPSFGSSDAALPPSRHFADSLSSMLDAQSLGTPGARKGRLYSPREWDELQRLFVSLAAQSRSNGQHVIASVFQAYYGIHGSLGGRLFEIATQGNKDGLMRFQEFAAFKAVFDKGSPDEIDRMCFQVMDVLKSGKVDSHSSLASTALHPSSARSSTAAAPLAASATATAAPSEGAGGQQQPEGGRPEQEGEGVGRDGSAGASVAAADTRVYDDGASVAADDGRELSYQDAIRWWTAVPAVKKFLRSLLTPPDLRPPLPTLIAPPVTASGCHISEEAGEQQHESREDTWLLQKELTWHIAGALQEKECREWCLLYSSKLHGLSFNSFLGKVSSLPHPTVLVVRDSSGAIFGAFASKPWERGSAFYGDMRSILFSFLPTAAVFKAAGTSTNIQWCASGFASESIPNGIGLGGQPGHFALFLSSDFDSGHSRPSTTFNSSSLSSTPNFNIDAVECWAVISASFSDRISAGDGGIGAVGSSRSGVGSGRSDDAGGSGRGTVLDRFGKERAMLGMIGIATASENIGRDKPDREG